MRRLPISLDEAHVFRQGFDGGQRRDSRRGQPELNRELRLRFEYSPGSTVVSSPLEEILERRVGVCQDFAHVLIALARHLGWPARYVSGYLVPEEEPEGFSHAWVEVGSVDGRWLGLDPTHRSATGDWHVAVAVGRDYSDVSPMRGVFVSEEAGMPPEVSVRIAALDQ